MKPLPGPIMHCTIDCEKLSCVRNVIVSGHFPDEAHMFDQVPTHKSKWFSWVHLIIIQDMMTSSNGTIFHVTGPLCGEFTGPGGFPAQRPLMRSFDIFFDQRLNKRLSKQPWGWWFETLPWSLWRQCNEYEPQKRRTGVWVTNATYVNSFV